jgi:hypothetical protein
MGKRQAGNNNDERQNDAFSYQRDGLNSGGRKTTFQKKTHRARAVTATVKSE